MAAQNGETFAPNYHVLTGNDLTEIVAAPGTFTFVNPSQWNVALPANSYQAFMAEPFVNNTIGQETTAYQTLLAASLNQAKSLRVYVYEGWPTMTNYGANYQTYWNASITAAPGDQMTMQKAAVTAVYNVVKAAHNPNVWVADAGTVFAAIDAAARAGQIPGASTVADFYRDDQHMGQAGQYVAACTIYSVIWRQPCPTQQTVVSFFTAGGPLTGLALDTTNSPLLSAIVWTAVQADPRAFH